MSLSVFVCLCLFCKSSSRQIISFQKIYGLYGLEHHMVEISGDVTDVGRTNERTNERTREDSATQPMEAGWLSFAILYEIKKRV